MKDPPLSLVEWSGSRRHGEADAEGQMSLPQLYLKVTERLKDIVLPAPPPDASQ